MKNGNGILPSLYPESNRRVAPWPACTTVNVKFLPNLFFSKHARLFLNDNIWTLRIVALNPMQVVISPDEGGQGQRRRPGRSAATRERALSTAAEILRRDGYSRLTIERIAAESGVAKTSIYRRWPTKVALCVELYLEVAARELQDPDTGDVASDLRHIINTVVFLQTRTVAGPALIGIIAEAQANPASSSASLAQFAERRREITRRVLERALQRGQLRTGTDVDLVIDALGGATTFRLLQGHAPLSRKFADALVDLVLSGCRAPEPGLNPKETG
jgi:AcrR family transcriptional regulator